MIHHPVLVGVKPPAVVYFVGLGSEKRDKNGLTR